MSDRTIRYLAVLALLAAAAVPADLAARPRSHPHPPPSAPAAPAAATAEGIWAKKAACEAARSKVDADLAALKKTCADARGDELKRACAMWLSQLEHDVAGAQWTYDTGNYDDATRAWVQLSQQLVKATQACEKARGAVDTCVRQVQAAAARMKALDARVAKLKDPASKAACEKALADAAKTFAQLEQACATGDPAAPVKALGPAVKAVDEVFRRAK